MNTSLKEILELQTLGASSYLENNLRWSFVGEVMDISHGIKTFISKYIYFKISYFLE